MTTWEYLLLEAADLASGPSAAPVRWFRLQSPTPSREAITAHLNRLGAEGWELVSCDLSGSDEGDFAVFKRAKR